MRNRRCTIRGALVLVAVMLATAGCGSDRRSGVPRDEERPVSVSWSNEVATERASYARIRSQGPTADFVAATFTPSNDASGFVPVTNDFGPGDWLFRATLATASGKVEPGTYSGASLPDAVLYYFDRDQGQTRSQILSTSNARIVISELNGTVARGFIELRDDEDGFEVNAGFQALITSQ